ncbi:MAG TPA: ATP-binding protein [Bryobacteraceae bacterium]
MANRRSIGVRLMVWYLLILSLGFAIFAAGTWVAIRVSARDAVDAELNDRLRGLEQFMRVQISGVPDEPLAVELHEHSVLGPGGDLFQVCDDRGAWVYRSAVLEKAGVPILQPSQISDAPVYGDVRVQSKPLRTATTRVTIAQHTFAIQVASPMSAVDETLHRLSETLWLMVPLLLVAAGMGGFWISRRALAPVDAITTAAESISISHLSNRLVVPATGDELERLSETMNRMLGRLESSVARMTQFTADASHELRAPVAVIRTTAELAVRGHRSAADLRADMEQILAESERTTRLIESLLLMARADSVNADGLQMEPTDFAGCVREAIEQVRTIAAASQISVRFSCAEPGAMIVSGDSDALRRMIFNLLDNGVKYNRPGGSVEVRVSREGDRAVCAVTDTGGGIAAADHPYIFDRFWRADKARSRASGGSGGAGLGLSIARWIAERHMGTISVESEQGRGAAFRVSIPLEHGVPWPAAPGEVAARTL